MESYKSRLLSSCIELLVVEICSRWYFSDKIEEWVSFSVFVLILFTLYISGFSYKFFAKLDEEKMVVQKKQDDLAKLLFKNLFDATDMVSIEDFSRDFADTYLDGDFSDEVLGESLYFLGQNLEKCKVLKCYVSKELELETLKVAARCTESVDAFDEESRNLSGRFMKLNKLFVFLEKIISTQHSVLYSESPTVPSADVFEEKGKIYIR